MKTAKISKNLFKSLLILKKKVGQPVSLRTEQDEKFYGLSKRTGGSNELIDEPRLKEWEYWALIDNKFPYSIAFQTHHMLIPKRITNEDGLTMAEWTELQAIFHELDPAYDCRMVNTLNKQSKKTHFHIHYMTYKTSREDFRL